MFHFFSFLGRRRRLWKDPEKKKGEEKTTFAALLVLVIRVLLKNIEFLKAFVFS